MNPIRYLRRIGADVTQCRSSSVATAEGISNLAALLNDKLAELIRGVAKGTDAHLAQLSELNSKLSELTVKVAAAEEESANSAAKKSDKLVELTVEPAPQQTVLQQRQIALITAEMERDQSRHPTSMTGPDRPFIFGENHAEVNITKFYQENGYYIFRNALSRNSILELRQALDREVVGSEESLLRLHGVSGPHDYVRDAEGRSFIGNAILDPHRQPATAGVAGAIQTLICNDEVADLLKLVDGAVSHTIHQTLIFFTSPGTDLHFDGWGLDSYPFGYSHTLWVPLESVTLTNGPLAVIPWTVGKYLSPKDLGFGSDFLANADDGMRMREDYDELCRRYVDYMRQHHPDNIVPQMEPGDFIVFSSQTPHRTMPPSGRSLSRMARQLSL